MKKSITILFSISLILLLTACGGIGDKKAEPVDLDDFNTQSALGMYEMSVPKYMKEATDLNADASMQYQNVFKETYLAVIDEDKDEFVDAFKELGEYDDAMSASGNYRNIQVKYFLENLNVIRKGEPKKVSINGMEAEQIEFEGRVDGVNYDIFYVMTFVEGRDNLYMVMTWTLGDSKDKYKDTFYAMSNSFNEI